MGEGHVTIKDIAKALNLSTATVSRALRGVPEIRPQTKQAVLELARDLKYQPNHIARSLVRRKTKTIGVVLPHVVNLFFASIIQGIQALAYKTGYNLITCYSNERTSREIENIRELLAGRVDGLLVCLAKETTCLAHLEDVVEKKIPLVLFDRILQGFPASSVAVDDYRGAYQAVEHLLQMGCRRVAHIGGPQNLYTFKQRTNAYLDVLKKYGIAPNPDYLICGGFTAQDGTQATQTLMQCSSPPDGIFAVSDTVALGISYTLRNLSIPVPQQVALVGFANENFSPYMSPSLTTVDQKPYYLGETAFRLLIEQILTDSASFQPKLINLKPRLIIRESSQNNKISSV